MSHFPPNTASGPDPAPTGTDLGEFVLNAAPPSSPDPWPPVAKAAAFLGSGCVVLVALEFVVLVAGLQRLARPDPSLVKASVSVPPHVPVGQTFPLTLTIRTQRSTAASLTSVHAGAAVLQEFRLENPRPAAVSKPESVSAGATWKFARSIPPHGTLRVTFSATARQAGEHTESLDIQVGSHTESIWFTLTAIRTRSAR